MILALILQAFFAAPAKLQAPPPPNVLVVALDDWGVSEPLNVLASEGLTFTQARAFPTCSPTRLAALFGHLPRRDGIGDVKLNAHNASDERLPLELTSLFEVVTPTHATTIVGKWHLGRAPLLGQMDQITGGPYCQGAESWHAGSPTSVSFGTGATGYYNWNRVEFGRMLLSGVYATDAQRDEFIAWWSSTAGPKFGWLALNAAHAPYDTPPGYVPAVATRDRYLQVAQYAEAALEEVLLHIDLGDTYVFVLGDNGTPDDARLPGTPGGFWKGSTYEGGIRVPFRVAGPGITPGTTSRLVSVVDLPATICELLGLPALGQDSQSFADELGAFAGSAPRSWVFSERYDTNPPSGSAPQPLGYDDMAFVEAPTLYPGTSVVVQLKRRIVDADGNGPGGTADLVYDLVADQFELAPVPYSTVHPAIRARFDGYLAGLPPRL